MKQLGLTRLATAVAAIGLGLGSGTGFAQDGEQNIEEVVVTGSYIKRKTTADSPSPLSVLDKQEIDNLGVNTVSEIVDTLTYNAGSTNNTNAFSGGDNSVGNTNVNLRNLGLGSTLVLINGRRMLQSNFDQSGNGYVNLSSIVPNIALERLEVVKDGASALYGSDAVAGVVNFLTRNDFEGMEIQFDASTDTETNEQNDFLISGIVGASNDRGHIVLAASYLERSPLTIGDRYDRYGRTGLSTFGQPGSYVPLGLPISTTTGLPTAFGSQADLDCEQYVDPSGRGGTLGVASNRCIYDFSSFFYLVGEETRNKVFGSVEYELTDSLNFYGDVLYSKNSFKRDNSLFPDVSFAIIPPNHPGLVNDAERRGIQPIPYLALQRLLGGEIDTPDVDRPIDTETKNYYDTFRISTGLEYDFNVQNRSWTADLNFTYSERLASGVTRSDTLTDHTNLAYVGLGGPDCDPINGVPGSGNRGTGGCYYYNPFGSSRVKPDGSPQDDPLLLNPVELYQWMAGEIAGLTRTQQTVAEAVVAGELFEMPNGLPFGLALGIQFRRDEIKSDADKHANDNNYKFVFGARDYEGGLDTTAFFFEAAIPVLETLDIQIAGRYEDFDQLNENTFDPKITALWRPTDDLSVRASAGTSFRVGSLLQLFGSSTTLLNSTDAFSGAGGLAFRPSIAEGNPNLAPEESTAWNIGFSYSPKEGVLEGLSVDFDLYSYDYKDLITRQGHQELINLDNALRCPQGVSDGTDGRPQCGVFNGVIFNDPAGTGGIPDQVIRSASGNLLRTLPSYVNAQNLETSGIDFDIGYTFDMNNAGVFNVGLAGSYVIDYDLTLPDGTVVDGAGSRNNTNSVGRSLPELKLNGRLAWTLDRHAAILFVRYVDSYEDDAPQNALRASFAGFDVNNTTIDSWTTVDAQYNYTLPEIGFLAEGSVLTIGARNLFNEDPPVLNFDGGYDPFVHDPRGRILYGRVTLQF